jgi:hypothetical protein
VKSVRFALALLAAGLWGCYLFTPTTPSSVTSLTVDPAYITVGPGEQATLAVTTDPPDLQGEISWSTEDEYFAIVSGTSKVGLVTGKHLGSTTLTATISGVSAQVLCNVVPSGEAGGGAYLSSPETVIAMAPGDSRNISAQLVGGGEQDQNAIQWQVKDSSVLDILGQGPNALVTALSNGTTQIILSHPLTGSTFTISVRVDGSTKALLLSKNNFIMNPGDIQELDASITNETAADVASIVWSVRAGSGTDSSFLSIIGNGGLVNLIANSHGQGTVMALYGSQVVECEVIVQPNKKMAFQTGVVSGNPGDTFTIGYDYSPATMNVFWTLSDASVASYSDNRVGKKLAITLLKEGTATLRGTLSDGVTSDALCITSKWDRSIVLSQTSIYGAPSDGATAVTFTVSPPGTAVSASSDDTSVATVSVDNASRTITVTPHKEGQASISVSTPDVSASISCSYSYTSLGVNITYSFSSGSSTKTSGLSSGTIYIANRGGSATLTAAPSSSGATAVTYSWSYVGEDDGGNLTYGTAGENVYAFAYSAPAALIAGSKKTGTLYLTVDHNGTNILSTSWPIYIIWD